MKTSAQPLQPTTTESKNQGESPMSTHTPTVAGTPTSRRPLNIIDQARSSGWARELALLPAIILAMVIGAILSPQFLTANNLLNNVLVTSAVLGIVVIAESIILISGYFDLSSNPSWAWPRCLPFGWSCPPRSAAPDGDGRRGVRSLRCSS